MLKERIRELCKEKGVKATQVESDLGLAQGYISKLDKSSPSLTNVKALADYFGVSLEYIANGENAEKYYLNDETTKIAQKVFDDPNLRLLFDAAQNVKPENIRLAAEMLLRLKETNPNG